MADPSFWDAATDFNARDVAELAVTFGTKPTELDGTKIRTLYERMECSYHAKVEWHKKPDDEPVYGREFGSVKPDHMLESVEMTWAEVHDPTDDGLGLLMWLRDPNLSAFETQRFTRPELARWFAAVGVPSRYAFQSEASAVQAQFEKPLGTTERNTLLIIIAALCKDAKYDFTMAAKTAGMIHTTVCSMVDNPVGETTIEGHLKKVPDALGTRMK